MKGLRLAVGTLTILPVGDLRELTPRDGRDAMLWSPVAALPLGLVTTLVLWVATLVNAPMLVAGFVVVGLLAYGTRAMHLDGLADTVDGFGGGWTRERALDIMKKGDAGPMGVAAIVVSLGLQATAFGALSHAPLVAGAAVVASRLGCTAMASTQWRAARAEGLGALMASSVSTPALAAVTLGWGAVLAGAAVASGMPVYQPILAVCLAAVALVWLGRRATRVIGGVTGDVFGAAVEVTLTVLLIVLACGGTA